MHVYTSVKILLGMPFSNILKHPMALDSIVWSALHWLLERVPCREAWSTTSCSPGSIQAQREISLQRVSLMPNTYCTGPNWS